MAAVTEALEAMAGRLNPQTMQWEGSIPSTEIVERSVALAVKAELPATELERQNAAKLILAGYPSTHRWEAAEMGATRKQYADAMEGAFQPVVAELAHPKTSPFGSWPPTAGEIAKAVEAGNARVRSIRLRAKMIENKRAALIIKAEEGEPVSPERRREIMDEVGYEPKQGLPEISARPASPGQAESLQKKLAEPLKAIRDHMKKATGQTGDDKTTAR